jgi:hypothetical protein
MIRHEFVKPAINLVSNMTQRYKIVIVRDWIFTIYRGA